MRAMAKAQREWRERQELLARHEAGTPQKVLAAELKVGASAISKRLRLARRDREEAMNDAD